MVYRFYEKEFIVVVKVIPLFYDLHINDISTFPMSSVHP
jgi:hypothetical protein